MLACLAGRVSSVHPASCAGNTASMTLGRLAWEFACAALCLAVSVVGAAVGIAGGVWHVMTSTQGSRLPAKSPMLPDSDTAGQETSQTQTTRLEDNLQQLHQELTSKLGQQNPPQQSDHGDIACPPSHVANWTPRSSMDSTVSATPDGRFSLDMSGPARPAPHESGLPQPPQKLHRLHQEGKRYLPEE